MYEKRLAGEWRSVAGGRGCGALRPAAGGPVSGASADVASVQGGFSDLVRWWWERREESPFLLLPSREEAAELTLALGEWGGPLVGPGVAGTFDDLAAMLLGGHGSRLGEVARQAVVAQVASPFLSLPGSVLGRLHGPPAGLANLVEEMEESGLGEEGILRALGGWEERAAVPAVRGVAAEIREIYARYAADCRHHGWQGRASTLRAAALSLAGGPREAGGGAQAAPSVHPGIAPRKGSGAVWSRPVACSGFLSFTPVQHMLLDALPTRCAVMEGPPRGDPGPRPGVALRLLESAGRRGEMETVAAEVVELMRSGLEAEEIALVARRAGPWRRVAHQVFSAYGIPLRVDAPFRLWETGLGNALVTVLRGLLSGENGALIAYLRGRYSSARPLELRGAQLAKWQAVLSWPGSPTARHALVELFPAEMALIEGCMAAGATGGLVLRLPGLAALARSMFTVSSAALSFQYAGVGEDARALRAWLTALAELDDSPLFKGGWSAPAEGGAGAGNVDMLDILANATLWPSPACKGGVVLKSAARLHHHAYRAIFVLGLVDQEFPEAERGSGLLPVALRRECNRLGGARLFEDPVEDLDTALFNLAVSRGTEFVYLSRRMSQENGTPLSPSPFLPALEATPGGLCRWGTRTLADVVHSPRTAPSHREYLRACAGLGLLPAAKEDAALLTGVNPLRRPAAGLADAGVLNRLRSRITFAAGEIESYAHCPLAWFLERQVGVRAAEEDAGPKDLGLLVHEVLADLYKELLRRGLLPLNGTVRTAALECAERVLSDAAAGYAAGAPGARAILFAQVRYRVREHIYREAAQGGSMKTEAVEVALPTRGVSLGNGLVVNGRVDRVDVSPSGDGFAVIDYKSGRYVPPKSWVEEGLLQVPLYLLALAELRPGRRVLGGGYLFMGRGAGKGLFSAADQALLGAGAAPWKPVSREELDGQLEDCRQAAGAAVQGMREARLMVDAKHSCPRFCRLGPVCRHGEATRGRRA